MKQRTLLLTVLSVLFVILGVLVYLYVTLVRPLGPAVSPDVVGLDYLFSIYGYGDKANELLEKPIGVAVDKDENIYISDTDHHRVLAFDEDGDFLFKFGKEGDKPGELKFPLGLTVSPKGNIYVCDKAQSKIVIYDSKGKFIKEVYEMAPLAATVALNKLYVATYGHVVVYDLEGNLISRWGKRGRNPGDFDFPGGIAVDKAGNVYVSDSNNGRLQALDKNGEVLWVVGKPPKSMSEANRRFGLPDGLAMDDEGRLFVVDAFRSTIQVYSNKGKKLSEIGRLGHNDGEFFYPSEIAYSGGNKFAVSDRYNNRIQVVRLSVVKKSK